MELGLRISLFDPTSVCFCVVGAQNDTHVDRAWNLRFVRRSVCIFLDCALQHRPLMGKSRPNFLDGGRGDLGTEGAYIHLVTANSLVAIESRCSAFHEIVCIRSSF